MSVQLSPAVEMLCLGDCFAHYRPSVSCFVSVFKTVLLVVTICVLSSIVLSSYDLIFAIGQEHNTFCWWVEGG